MAIDRECLQLDHDVLVAPQRSPSPKSKKQGTPLPDDFKPGNHDVICAKGKAVANHAGNKRFRVIVRSYLQKYSFASSKQQKSRIVSAIVDTVRQSSKIGGFVKLDPITGKWYVVSDHHAREKVGQTLRDALHTKYSSSTKAKKYRRQAEKAKARKSMLTLQLDASNPTPSSASEFGTHDDKSLRAAAFTPEAHQPAKHVEQQGPVQALPVTFAALGNNESCLDTVTHDNSEPWPFNGEFRLGSDEIDYPSKSTAASAFAPVVGEPRPLQEQQEELDGLSDIFFEDKTLEVLTQINDTGFVPLPPPDTYHPNIVAGKGA